MNSSTLRSPLHAGFLTLLALGFANAALAQTSNNLTGCLNPGGSLTKVALGDLPQNACSSNETQVTWTGANPTGSNGAFYIALSRETERVIATKGNLTLTARCTAIDPEFPNEMTIRLVATGAVEGWRPSGEQIGELGPQLGGAQLSLHVNHSNTVSMVTLVTPAANLLDDASYLGIHNLQLGVNIFSRDCVLSGTFGSASRLP